MRFVQKQNIWISESDFKYIKNIYIKYCFVLQER